MKSTLKVLVVDDSADLLETFSFFLEYAGYEVKTLNSTKSVDVEIMSFKPDIILLDIFVKPIDGREICKDLRRREATANLPVILMSTYHKAVEAAAGIATDTLKKPFNIADVFYKINNAIENVIPIL